jgi:nicotinamidase-related amidase
VASHGAWHPIDPGHNVDVILVVDMQAGLMEGAPKHDLRGVIDRINRLTAMVRGRSGKVVWIRHCGKPGDGFEPRTAGWAFLPELVRRDEDLVIEKTLNDPFAGTPLKETLDQLTPDRVLITGWATDFCVDATVRSAVSNGYHAVAVADGHTLSDRPHLDAASVIRHHNWVWSGLITNRSIAVMTTTQLLDGRQPSPWPKS